MGVKTSLTGVPDFDKFEIIKVGNGVLPSATATAGSATWASGSSTNTYAHNLGFIPTPFAFLVSTNASGDSYYLPFNFVTIRTAFGVNLYYINSGKIQVDSTNVYLRADVTTLTSSAGGVTIGTGLVKYYLCRNIAA